MKKLTIALIAIWSLVALCLLGILVSGIALRGFRGVDLGPTEVSQVEKPEREERVEQVQKPDKTDLSSDSRSDLLVDRTESMEGIDELYLTFSSDNVTIHPATDGNLRMIHRGINLPKENAATIERRGSQLTVTRPTVVRQGFTSFQTRSDVDIYIPTGYSEDLEVKLSSGNFTMDVALSVSDLDVTLSSGNIRVNQPLIAEEANLKVSSGNLQMTGLTAEEYSLVVSSGNMTLESLYGSGDAQISSGNMTLRNVAIEEDLSVKTSSGVCKLFLLDDNFTYKASKSSGNIHTFFPTTASDNNKAFFATVGEGSRKSLEVQVSSGSVSIEKSIN